MKRVITLVLAMAMALSVCSVAYADGSGITVKETTETFKEIDGTVSVSARIESKHKDAFLRVIQPTDGYPDNAALSASFTPDVNTSYIKIPEGNSPIQFTVKVDSSTSENCSVTMLFYYYDETDNGNSKVVSCTYEFKIKRTSPTGGNTGEGGSAGENPDNAQTEEPKKEDSEFRIRTSSVDSNGVCVLTPSGDYGDQLEVRLPLTCTNGYVYDLKVTPVLSNDIEKFPFDIDLVDYTLSYPGSIGRGQVVEFLYHLRLSKKATVGVKQVDFNVTYRNDEGDLKSGTVSLFVNVRKGLSPTSDKDTTTSVPKLIIESYKLSSDKIYAGETFDLEFNVKNTSDNTNLQNVQIHIKDAGETATIVPASGGSNTLYISKIGKGQSSSQKVSLQTAPDAAAKAYTLNVDFSYESATTNAAHTANETIAVPILQKIRLKCDEPTVYDDVSYLDSSTSMSIKMYNMGRSSVYNCIVDVEGNGLKLEESYFGGTLSAGSTLSADISVIPSEAGDIQGTVVISYEDVYGEPGEERLPFTLHVEDPNAGMENMEGMEGMGGEGMEGGMTDPGMEGGSKGFPWWGWVIGAGALGGGGFFGFKKLKKRRARSLEDDI